MGVHDFDSLREHVWHKIVCVVYGDNGNDGKVEHNVAIECEDCSTVMIDYDKETGDEV